jgi:hypothetical protein
MSVEFPHRRPATLSSVLAVIIATSVLVSLAQPQWVLWPWLGVELLGIAIGAVGAVAYHRDFRITGIAVGVIGAAFCLAALGGFLTRPLEASELVRLGPGFVGIAVVAAALAPVRGSGSRALVKTGAGALFACIMLTGLFQILAPELLLAATVGTVLVWDMGENAIGIGQQVGRRARTWRLELTHLAGTTLVGVAGTAAVLFVQGFAVGSLSLASFGLAFVALVLLTLGIRW